MLLALSETGEKWTGAIAAVVALLAVVAVFAVKYRRGIREDEARDAQRVTASAGTNDGRRPGTASLQLQPATSQIAAARAQRASMDVPADAQLPQGLPTSVVLVTTKGKTKDIDIKISGAETYRLLVWVLALSGGTTHGDIKGETPLPAAFYWFTQHLAEELGYLVIENVPTEEADIVHYVDVVANRKQLTELLVTSARVLSLAYQSYRDYGKVASTTAETKEIQADFKRKGLLPAAKTFHYLQSAYQASGQEIIADEILLWRLLHWLLVLDKKRGVSVNPELTNIPQPSSYASLSKRVFDLVVEIRNDDTFSTTTKMSPEEVLRLAPARVTRLFAEYATYLHVLHGYFSRDLESDDARMLKECLPDTEIFEELELFEDIHFPEV